VGSTALKLPDFTFSALERKEKGGPQE